MSVCIRNSLSHHTFARILWPRATRHQSDESSLSSPAVVVVVCLSHSVCLSPFFAALYRIQRITVSSWKSTSSDQIISSWNRFCCGSCFVRFLKIFFVFFFRLWQACSVRFALNRPHTALFTCNVDIHSISNASMIIAIVMLKSPQDVLFVTTTLSRNQNLYLQRYPTGQ